MGAGIISLVGWVSCSAEMTLQWSQNLVVVVVAHVMIVLPQSQLDLDLDLGLGLRGLDLKLGLDNYGLVQRSWEGGQSKIYFH